MMTKKLIYRFNHKTVKKKIVISSKSLHFNDSFDIYGWLKINFNTFCTKLFVAEQFYVKVVIKKNRK